MITPRDALANLDNVAARVVLIAGHVGLTRGEHAALQESTAVLAALIDDDEKRKATEAEASKP